MRCQVLSASNTQRTQVQSMMEHMLTASQRRQHLKRGKMAPAAAAAALAEMDAAAAATALARMDVAAAAAALSAMKPAVAAPVVAEMGGGAAAVLAKMEGAAAAAVLEPAEKRGEANTGYGCFAALWPRFGLPVGCQRLLGAFPCRGVRALWFDRLQQVFVPNALASLATRPQP